MKMQLDSCLNEASQRIEKVNWKDSNTYGDFLAQTYYFVCHSTRLLAFAASRFSHEQDPFFKRFVEHLGEEKNHEKIALSDLKSLKCSLSDHPEKPETRAFYESQYYKIEFQTPFALLGYILFLEAIAVHEGPSIYNQVKNAFGVEASKFLRVHVEEDPDHVTKALDVIQMLNPQQKEFIEANLIQSAKVYGLIMDSLGRLV